MQCGCGLFKFDENVYENHTAYVYVDKVKSDVVTNRFRDYADSQAGELGCNAFDFGIETETVKMVLNLESG